MMMMMRTALLAGFLTLTATSAVHAAAPMSVATFLGKAESLRKKGPLALMSPDLKLLTNQIKADSTALRTENQALAAAGKRKSYCTPDDFKMNQNGIMAAMREVEPARRASTSTRTALRDFLSRRHPCRG